MESFFTIIPQRNNIEIFYWEYLSNIQHFKANTINIDCLWSRSYSNIHVYGLIYLDSADSWLNENYAYQALAGMINNNANSVSIANQIWITYQSSSQNHLQLKKVTQLVEIVSKVDSLVLMHWKVTIGTYK